MTLPKLRCKTSIDSAKISIANGPNVLRPIDSAKFNRSCKLQSVALNKDRYTVVSVDIKQWSQTSIASVHTNRVRKHDRTGKFQSLVLVSISYRYY